MAGRFVPTAAALREGGVGVQKYEPAGAECPQGGRAPCVMGVTPTVSGARRVRRYAGHFPSAVVWTLGSTPASNTEYD